MKVKDWLNVLKESYFWIFLLCISNIFFVFLAWVAYPEAFELLVSIMIVFSAGNIAFGLMLAWKRQRRKDQNFYKFFREPSLEHESELIESTGGSHKEKINYLGNKLRESKDQLDEAKLQSTEYEEFIESWVHEIKTPIALANLVLENRKEEMSDLVYQRLEHARMNISDNVEQILFYSRLQAAHVDYFLEEISLNSFCKDVLLELQSLLDEKEVEVVFQMEDIPIVSDKKALKFILTQIFVNGIKYANEEIDSYIRLKTGFDFIRNRYYFKIVDNGIGVRQSDLPFICDKGFTGDNPNRNKSTGIGLYLVKKLCDELYIEIEVESQYEKGFTIQLLFPMLNDK